MAIHVALHHKTHYRYDGPVLHSPHIVRLRPAPHCRTPILSYSQKIIPEEHFINWQQDPFSNYMARLVFPQPTRELVVEIDLVAEMFLSGIMDRTGRIRKELGHPRVKVIDGEACFVVATEAESGSGRPVVISQNDIIQIQYAKAAMYAGAEILMEKMNVDRSGIKEILLAGAFGNYASPASARAIGLFPEVPLQHIVGIGNAAGSGAKISLVSRSAREMARRIARKVDYVELAAMPEFEEKFFAAMYFPHSDESKFPDVNASVRKLARDI